MTISIRLGRLDFFFEFKLLDKDPPEADEPKVMPTTGFFMPGPDYVPDDL